MYKFKNVIKNSHFDILKNNSKNFATKISKSLKPVAKQSELEKHSSKTGVSQGVLFDPSNQEFSKLRINLIYSLISTDKNIKFRPNYEEIYTRTIETINYYAKTKDTQSYQLINSTLLIFLEKHIQMFSLEQMIRLSGEMAKNNLGSVVLFNSFSDSIFKKLQMEKQKIMRLPEGENLKVTQMLYYYLSIMSEVSMMEVGPFNYILEYFSNHSNSLMNQEKELDSNNLKTLYDFTWLTSLSIASILEKRKSFKQVEPYVDTVSPVLNEAGARALTKLLKFIDSQIHNDKNYSENSLNKVRLFKSLYYLRLEGIKIPNNLNKFMDEFKNFHQMNMETSTTASTLELKFEKILTSLNIPFVREKKLPFCSVDFFVSPDIVLEVNGPSHYVFNSEYPIAKDLMKKRVLGLEHYDYNAIHYESIQADQKNLTEKLEVRFKHILEGFEEKVTKQIEEEKNYLNLKENEKMKRREKIEERILNNKYLV